MKINQSTFYAFRILHRLDERKDQVLTSREISDQEKLSQGVILRILQSLRRADIVYAHQGRGEISGGFSLAKSIDEITVFEVLEIWEGMDICANLEDGIRQKEPQMFRTCSWINGEFEKLLSAYTVRDLFEPKKAKKFFDTG